MKRGVKAKSLAEKQLSGNPGKRQLHNPIQPPSDRPVMPAWLDDEAKLKWRKLAPHLASLGLLTSVDGDNLAAYCQAYSEFKHACETLQKEGRYIHNARTGNVKAHPAIDLQRSAWAAMRQFSVLFGLSPVDRNGLSVGAPSDEDPFAALETRKETRNE